MEMTLMDNRNIHPRLRIWLFLLLLSLTHCKLCSGSTPTTTASAVDTTAEKTTTQSPPTTDRTTTAVPTTTTAVPTAAAPSDVTVESWTTTTIEVSWNHDDSNTEYYEIIATCQSVATETCQDGFASLNSPTTSGTVRNLTPGAEYQIVVTAYNAISQGNPSDPVNQRTYPNTVEALDVESPVGSTDSLKGSWETPVGIISSYRIVCNSSTGGDPQHKEDLDSEATEYTCTGLSAGDLYTMYVYTVSGTGDEDDKQESEPASKDKRVYPNKVGNLVVTSPDRSTNSIHGSWSKPEGLVTSYRIECISSSGGDPYNEENVPSGDTEYTCTGLSAGYLYNMSVYTVSGTGSEDDKLESAPASEDKRVYPNTVVDLDVTSPNKSTDSIYGSWTTPEGDISGYRVACISSTGGAGDDEDLDPSVTEYTCKGLSAGNLYNMSVYTVSGTGSEDDKLESAPASEDKRVYPKPSKILTTTTTNDSFIVTWDRPEGFWTGYDITYKPIDNQENAESGREEISDPNQSITSHTIGGLKAGTKYSVDLSTRSGEDGDIDPLYSDPDTETDRTIPATATNVRSEHVKTDSVDIAWDIDVTSLYDEFTVNYAGQLDTRQQVQVTSGTSARLPELRAGDTYTIEIYTHSHDKTSGSSVPINVTTEPLGPGDVVVTGKSDEEIRIQWAAPACDLGEDCNYDSYKITHEPEHGDVEQQSDLGLNARLAGLNPGELYNISVQAMSGNTESKPEIITDRTLTATPENFRVTNTTVTSLLVEWDKPIANFESYSITVDFVNEEQNKTLDNIKIPLPDKDDENPASNITDLDPFTEYNVTLTCLSPEPMRTESVPTYTQEETDIAPPPPSDGKPPNDPEVIITTKTTITVEFTDDIFIHDYGPVLYYSVIVTEENVTGGYDDYDPERGTDPDPQMTTWAQAHGRTVRYQIDERYEYPWPYEGGSSVRRRSPSSISIAIGENTTCNIDDTENYCNGPLKEGTAYRYQFRGYTAGGYTDTELSDPIYTAPGSDLTWLWILLGVLGGFLLALLVILGVILFLRKYPDAFKKKGDPLTGNENPMPMTDEEQERNKKKARKHSQPVKLTKYEDYFNTMSADMEFRFSEEYEELRSVGRDQTWEVSELANNRGKNRYTNILPYDRTRVHLASMDDDENSDYINANWMPGYNSPKEFIAAQGPLPGTKDDFWRMIWEYNVKTVVMVTQCTERGKVKCDHYWPFDNEPVYYGDIQVNVLSEEVFAEWTLRELNLENGGTNKKVRHFNFTAWPDHGVPEATQPLLHFVRAVRQQMPDDNSPTVVHCSAGVGRTGTFVALDRLIQHMHDNDYVDIYGIACEMRMHRMFMVQTESQYVFIHQCVSDLLREQGGGGEDDFPPPPFDEHIYGNVPPMRVRQPDIVANHDMVEGGGNDGDGADENTVADSGEVHVELEGGNGDNFPPPPRDDQVYDDVPLVREKPNSNTMGM